MLRADGEYTIYIIQRYALKNMSGKDDPHWQNCGDAHHWSVNIPDELKWKDKQHQGKFIDPWCSFGANGRVWQETGENGVYTQEKGELYVEQLAKYNPGIRFRLAKLEIIQKREPVYEVCRIQKRFESEADVAQG
jgi:hypothetical protein